MEACRGEVHSLLDRWYAAFNVTFTFQRPIDGIYDTIIVTSEGSWCSMDAQTVSYSPAPGLSHTTSLNDVMNEAATCHDGFEDRDNYVSSTQCRVLQNSYQLMLERLGASRPGSGS